jgi:hypothetical protein
MTDFTLTVVMPFGENVRGSQITDPAEIAKALEVHPDKVVRVAVHTAEEG